MKHLLKIVAFVITLLTLVQITYSGSLGVDLIEVVDNTTLKVTLSENPNLKVGDIDAEIAILSDVKLRGAFPQENDVKKVELLLETPLQANTTYSLLTVSGTDGSIDFTTPEAVEGFTKSNTASIKEQDIGSIEVIDDRTVLITYIQNLTGASYEYKLLAESKVSKIEKPSYDAAELIITVEPPFASEQDYILMIIDMQDVDGEHLEFDTGIYDFTTPVLLENEEIIEETMMGEEVLDVIQLEETLDSESENSEETIVLNAAGEEVSLEKTSNLEEVALSATATPDTGAETWVLVFATLFINSFYYIARRKKLQLA